MYDIISVGSATIDVFAHTDISRFIKILSHGAETDFLAYPAGSKILITELRHTVGGCGTNTATSFSRLGLKAAYLGKLGNDDHAKTIRQLLKKEKVTDLSVTGHQETGFAVVLDSIQHDRTILIHHGANDQLKWNEVKKNRLNTKWFYFSTLLGESYTTLKKLAHFAEKNKSKIALNLSGYLAKKGLHYLKEIITRANIVVLNAHEARLLTHKNPQEAAQIIHDQGPDIVAITNGKKGVTVYTDTNTYTIHPRKVKCVETTGAGDAFAAGFTAAIIKGKDIEFAIKLGQLNAESVIQHHGAKEKLLTWREAIKLMRTAKLKVQKTA